MGTLLNPLTLQLQYRNTLTSRLMAGLALSVASLAWLSFCSLAQAQWVFDISNLKADPQTLRFDDGFHTVQQFLYGRLQEYSDCCGRDSIHVEVEILPDGSTGTVLPLSGHNPCYKKSLQDLFKHIRWSTPHKETPQSVKIYLKPKSPCSGFDEDNLYHPMYPSFTEPAQPESGQAADDAAAPHDALPKPMHVEKSGERMIRLMAPLSNPSTDASQTVSP